MSQFYSELDKIPVMSAEIYVPEEGMWIATIKTYSELVSTSTFHSLTMGDLTLMGTIIPYFSGEFINQFSYRMVGGYYGWQKILPYNFYHNDAGVKLDNIINDVARECGENLIELSLPSNRLEESYYVRKEQPASRSIKQLISSPTQLWVDYDGNSHIGTRATNLEIVSDYDVLFVNPDNRTCTVSAFNFKDFVPGAIIKIKNNSLEEDFLIKSLIIKCTESELRIIAEK